MNESVNHEWILGLPGLQKICFGTWETAKLHYMFTREDVRVISKKKNWGLLNPRRAPKPQYEKRLKYMIFHSFYGINTCKDLPK